MWVEGYRAFGAAGRVGVPVEGIAMILGVDRFLDVRRTTLNVMGDLAAVVVARAEVETEPVVAEGWATVSEPRSAS